MLKTKAVMVVIVSALLAANLNAGEPYPPNRSELPGNRMESQQDQRMMPLKFEKSRGNSNQETQVISNIEQQQRQQKMEQIENLR